VSTRRFLTVVLITVTASCALSAGGAGAAPAPPDLDGEQVCALVDPVVVEEALTATVHSVAAGDTGTPQCSYELSLDGTTTNVLVAVMRVEADLDGRVGTKSFKLAVKLNKRYAGSAEITKVRGVGERATFFEGRSTNLLVVSSADGRVLTVAGSALDLAAARAVAQSALGSLGVA
jgi:hypothetical protein